MKPFRPVFVIGPGRSGTTLLYKLLALHSAIGYLSNFDARTPRWLPTPVLHRMVADLYRLKKWAWFSSSGDANMPRRNLSKKLVPTPSEAEPVYQRCGVGTGEYSEPLPDQVARCLRSEFIRLQSLQRSNVIVSKRTANNRRIPGLATAFPEARYILVIRDGRAVAESLRTVDWWGDHKVWWANDQTPRAIERTGASMLAIAARNWTEEVRTIREGLKVLDEQRVKSVRYEDLLSDPLSCLRDILEFIGVESCPAYESTMMALNISPRSEAWHRWSANELNAVMQIQREVLLSFDYS